MQSNSSDKTSLCTPSLSTLLLNEEQRGELEATLRVLRKSGVTQVRLGEIALVIEPPADRKDSRNPYDEPYSEETQFSHGSYVPDL